MIQIPASERYVIATAVGLHEQYLYQCFSRRRAMPSDRCPDIERASAGRVTVEQLRPDVRWVRVPDPTWPHPAGRPCIDVAGPSETLQQQRAA
jgi:hypothetical protein